MNHYIGVDIGGTKIKAVLLSGYERQNIHPVTIDTPKDKRACIAALQEIVRSAARNKKIAGIGVGAPGVVDSSRGLIIKCANLAFLDNMRLDDVFGSFKVPVRVENDSRCFVLAEAAWGSAMKYKHVVGVAIGTGIGGGIVIDGAIYRGSTNAAGEFGHTIFQIAEHDSRAPKEYSWEQLGSKQTFLNPDESARVIGIGVANIINMLDPEIIVLGGGGIMSGLLKMDQIVKTAREFLISPQARKTPIKKAALGDAAQAIGAALL